MTTNRNPIQPRRGPQWCAPLLAFALAVGGTACSDTAPITGPDALAPSPPPPGSWVVRGTVFEHTTSGMRPLAGVPLRVFESVFPFTKVVDVTSSAGGSYNVDAPETAHFVYVQVAPGSPYFAPCPPFTWSRDESLDVHIISGAILSTTGVPPSFPTNPTGNFHAVISGRVVERTSGGLEPVSAATVSLKEAELLPSFADTLTDTNGRYLLCSVGNSEVAVFVEARKEGYMPSAAEGLPGFGWDLDFELTRR